MHASKTARFLALFGALSMIAAALPLPADAQYYGYRSQRRYRAPRAYFGGGDALGRINDAYARGLISGEQASGLTAQYHSAIINDQRFGGTLHMNALQQNLDQAIMRNQGFRF